MKEDKMINSKNKFLGAVASRDDLLKIRKNLNEEINKETIDLIIKGESKSKIVLKIRQKFSTNPLFIEHKFTKPVVANIKTKYKKTITFPRNNARNTSWISNEDENLRKEIIKSIEDLNKLKIRRKVILQMIVSQYESNENFIPEKFNIRYIDFIRSKGSKK